MAPVPYSRVVESSEGCCSPDKGFPETSSTSPGAVSVDNKEVLVRKSDGSSKSVALLTIANDGETLTQCLFQSPDLLAKKMGLIEVQGATAVMPTIQQILRGIETKWLAVVHQDVYLPEGFLERAEKLLADLERKDEGAAVCGVIGLEASGEVIGETFSSGLGGIIGKCVLEPTEVVCLDEMILFIRSEFWRFLDPNFPGFHLYGTELVLAARANNLTSYVLPLKTVHHSRPLSGLTREYRESYRYLARQRSEQIPIATLMCTVSNNPFDLMKVDFHLRRRSRFLARPPRAQGSPKEIAKSLGWE